MILLRALGPDIGKDIVTVWYENYQYLPVVRARLDALMVHLRCQNREGWVRPYYDTLRDGVGEIRFAVSGINYRPLGFFGPSRGDFTFLFFATKTNRFSPSNAIDIAAKRRLEVIQDPNLSHVVKGRWNQT